MNDADRYAELQAKMRDAYRKTQTAAESAEFQDWWAEMEQIKNRNGGMPPVPSNEAA